MLILTDPRRTPDVLALAERLPTGAGLVYRAFGAADAAATACRLARMARAQGWTLLVGAGAALAQSCGAHGVHLAERQLSQAPRLRARWPGALITGAAHGPRALTLARACGLDAALLSTVFPSRSPSAGAPLGPVRMALLLRRVEGIRVYALGGVDGMTIRRLAGTGVSGVAAVGAGAQALDRLRAPENEVRP